MSGAPSVVNATYLCPDCGEPTTGARFFDHVATHRPFKSRGVDGYTRLFKTQAEADRHVAETDVKARDLRVGDTFTDPWLARSFVVARTVRARGGRQNVTTATGERFGYGQDATVVLTARP